MIITKALISDLKEVPMTWVFENYLKLGQKLTGQDVKIRSPFGTEDKVPSTVIYYHRASAVYKFKDFSTGKHGDRITLVQMLFDLSTRGEAAFKIIEDYNQAILNNKTDGALREFKVQQKYKVVEFKKRSWNNIDQKYWTQFHIGSKLLEHYNVFPLESYTMEKEEEGEVKRLVIEGRHNIYGYFRTDGTLYKIYQPMVKDSKFIKVREYIQGTDQLTYKTKYLVICSSLKDVMAFMKLGYKEAEAIAPDSENTLIPAHVISSYKLKYKAVCTLFDNDKPGIDAMAKYGEKYDLNGVILPMSKDLSDSMKDHGILQVKEVLTPLLKQALK